MPRVVHFEISADEPERAVKFYTDVFGWDVKRWGGPKDYWLITTGASDHPALTAESSNAKGRSISSTRLKSLPLTISRRRSQRMEAKWSCPRLRSLASAT